MDIDPQFKTADGCALRIWRDTAKNNFLSERMGRPVFDDVILCEVISPGSRDSTPVFEVVRDYHPDHNSPRAFGLKYAELRQYIDEFEKNEDIDSSLAGTPLKEWAEMPRTLAATLRAANVYTVDALSSLPDTKLSIVGPDGRTWRTKALAYIENAKNGAFATQLAADLDRMREDIASKDDTIAAMAAQIAELQRASGTGDTPPPPPPPPPTRARARGAETNGTPPDII